MIRDKYPIHETFQSPIFTDACRFPVTVTITGTVMNLKFPDRPVGPQDITIGNVVWIATANNKMVRIQALGWK